MNAGFELDALVAEKVMGMKVERGSAGQLIEVTSLQPRHERDLLNYSTDIASAWEVLEKFRMSGDYKLMLQAYPKDKWEIKAYHRDGYAKSCTTMEETLALTICVAALKAVAGTHKSSETQL